MKKTALIFFLAFFPLLSGARDLYYWGGISDQTTRYDRCSYRSDAKVMSPESICALVAVCEDMVRHPGGIREVPPPGLCAEYGYLLCKPGTAEAFATKATKAQRAMFTRSDYAAYFPSYGRELILLETKYYPNAGDFYMRLLDKLTVK